MKKISKIWFRYCIFEIVILYIVVCTICCFSYSQFLKKLVPPENLVFTENLTTYNKDDDIFAVHIIGENVVFRRITNIYISPFYWVKIPKIDFEYKYNISDPNRSTHIEGSQEFNVVDFLENGSLIAETYTINSPMTQAEKNFGYSPFFFGFCTDDFSIAGVSKYKFKDKINGGYIFAFYGQDNENFDEDSFMIAY